MDEARCGRDRSRGDARGCSHTPFAYATRGVSSLSSLVCQLGSCWNWHLGMAPEPRGHCLSPLFPWQQIHSGQGGKQWQCSPLGFWSQAKIGAVPTSDCVLLMEFGSPAQSVLNPLQYEITAQKTTMEKGKQVCIWAFSSFLSCSQLL